MFSRTLTEVHTTRTRLERELTSDVVELLICPVIVGGGTRALPDGVPLDLTFTRERSFDNGMVQLTYERRG